MWQEVFVISLHLLDLKYIGFYISVLTELLIGIGVVVWRVVICLNLLSKSVFSKEVIIDFTLGILIS